MAVWNKYEFTNKGKEIVARILAGETDSQITKIGISSADLSSTDIENLTALPSEKQTFGIVSSEVKDSVITVYATISNYGLTESYAAKAIGAYCTSGGEEVLLAVATAQTADTISKWDGSQVDNINAKFIIQLDDSASMTAKLDPDGYVRIKDIYNFIYPVGCYHLCNGSYKPADKFGGTWEKIDGKYVIASGTYNGKTVKAGDIVGESSHVFSIDEMAPHSHTRGTMNITASGLCIDDNMVGGNHGVPLGGAWYTSGKVDYDAKSHGGDGYILAFDAYRTWTGSTSIEGKGKAVPVMPLAIVMDIWHRTA